MRLVFQMRLLVEMSVTLFFVPTGGLSEWSKLESDLGTIAQTTSFSFICFSAPERAWVQGRNELYHSMNGGRHWERVPASVTFSNDGFGMQSISFADSNHGWILAGDTLCVSSDGGNSWTPQLLPIAEIRRICFASVLYGVACTKDSIYYTEDGGKTWRTSIVNLVETGAIIINYLYFSNQDRGFAALWGPGMDVGSILQTDDGGKSWNVCRMAYEYQTLWSDDGVHIIAAGVDGRYRCGIIETSFDGGRTWHYALVDPFINCVVFADDGRGVAVGGTNSIFETGDGGLTWQEKKEIGDEPGMSATAFGKSIYVLTTRGNIYRNITLSPTRQGARHAAFKADKEDDFKIHISTNRFDRARFPINGMDLAGRIAGHFYNPCGVIVSSERINGRNKSTRADYTSRVNE